MISYLRLCTCLYMGSHLCSATPVITEFMASNQNSIGDEDGFKADWIEIHNPDSVPVDMTGWALTDSESSLQKWIFPAEIIPAKGYLIVFASNKNRRIPGQPLHTNFALSASGEYLALVKPDGIAKSTEFSPGFPQQFGDVSYGAAKSVTEQIVVNPRSPVRVRIPTSDTDGIAWRATGFDDSDWTVGTLAAGFFNAGGTSAIDLGPRLGTNLSGPMAGKATSAYLRIPFNVTNASEVTEMKLRMNYDDGFAAFINGFHAISSAATPPVASLNYQSGATTQHSPFADEDAYEDFDITLMVPQLVSGANVLALHGVNAGAGSSDFYIEPQLLLTVSNGGGGETGYFATATPGAPNGGPETLQLPQRIAYSKPSGTFTSTFSLTITGTLVGQQIRFIIADPSGNPNANIPEPTLTSPLYTGPINIASSKIIRAAVFNPANGQKGLTLSAQYLLLETGPNNKTSDFTSRLPIVVVDQHGGGGYGPGEPYKTSFLHVFDKTAGTARLNSTPTLFSRISQKVRGSSSAHFPKRAYGMKTRNEEGENLKHGILGLAPDNNWVWYNPWKYDDSYVRNAFMFQMSRDMGRWASKTQPVEMFLNVNGGKLDYNDYYGVYVLTEKIESGKDRLDIETIESSDITGDSLTGSYILKIDRADEDETNWTTPTAQAGSEDRIVLVEPEQEDEKPEQVAYIQNYIADFETALIADRAGNWQTRNYRKYIDVGSWVDVHMLNAFSLNPDSFRLSSYFHKDRNGKLKAGPIWDFDRALFADVDAGQMQRPPTEWNGTHFDMSWWKQIWRDPEFIQAWVDRWWELRTGPMSDGHINDVITTMGDEIGNTVGERDAARWPGTDGNSPETGSYLGEIAALRNWLTSTDPVNLGRTNWIDSQVPHPPEASLPSGEVIAGTVVNLSNLDGATSIRYRTDGTDPRPEGGANSNAPTYNSALPINQTTVLKARRYRPAGNPFTPFPHSLNTRWSAPLTRVYLVNEKFAAPSDLTVTEIHYSPSAPSTTERSSLFEVSAEKFEFIELRNTGIRTVNTFGIHIPEGAPFKAIALEPMTLAPGQFALVVKNRDAFLLRYGQGLSPLIAGEWGDGSLSNDGEILRILAKDGTTIHDSTYPSIATAGASAVNSGAGWKKDAPSPGALGPSYVAWKNFHFPSGGPGSGMEADADQDGAGNLLEYGRGTDPAVTENQLAFSPAFTLLGDGISAKYVFQKPVDRPDATYQVEVSSDLKTWSDVPSSIVSTGFGIETLEVNIPADGVDPATKFLRLKTIVSQ